MLNSLLFLTDDITGMSEDAGVGSLKELASTGLGVAIIIVGILIILVGLVSAVISVVLFFKYWKFNHKKNSAGLAGKDVARQLLDQNGLEKIRVKAMGSILFGNSYSHYFKKVRLRRMIWKKDSLTSLAMAAQKTGLAVLDKEEDPDMKSRVRLTPLITFGPYAFIPIIIIGVLLDYLFFGTVGFVSIISAASGFMFMILSLILQIRTLKTEVKAEEKAYVILKQNGMATDEEIEMMKELFKLYNIEYVNNIILAFLEIIYKILITVYKATQNSKLKLNND